jgi:hypothetical protein
MFTLEVTMQLASQAILGLTFLALPVTLVAQDSIGELRGSVVNIRREPLRVSRVVLRGTGIDRTVDSDDAGLFGFAAVPAGVYELTISAPLFYPIAIQAVHLQTGAVHVLPPVELVFEGLPACNTRIPAYLRPLDRFNSDRGALGGMLVDEHGRALAGARVTLLVRGGLSNSTITDREGRFSITDIPRDYRIRVVREGYFPDEFTDFKILAGYEAVYDRLYLEPCERGRCQPSLKQIRVLPSCA